MSLHMLHLEVTPRPLYEWARQIGITTRDRGYLIHSAMRATFGKAAPQPFVVMGNGHTPRLKILGYAPHGKSGLVQALTIAEPVLSRVFSESTIDEKHMPTLPVGTEFGFRVECCPITRCSQPNGKPREKDVFLAACDAHPEGGLDRVAVYADWLAAELGRNGAAELMDASMCGFRLVVPVRRSGEKPKSMGKRPLAAISGTLRVRDAEAFGSLLARGIGRHRAFGLGMILLRPV